jgi:hypothetical protein
MLYNVPEFFRPTSMKFDKNQYDNQFRVIHPILGSEILGEVGENIGRSGRYSAFFIDEAQDLSHPQKADEGLESATRVRGDIGTARGMNHFGKKWKSKAVVNLKIMWHDDPRKTRMFRDGKPDYECWWRKFTELVNRDNPAKIAQEYDMDFQASVPDICIPAEWVEAAVDFELEGNDVGDVAVGFDVAGGGSDSSTTIVRVGNRVEYIHNNDEKHPTRSMWKAYAIAREFEANALNYDSISIGESMYGLLMDSDQDIPFQLNPINGANACGDHIVEAEGLPANKVYYNVRSEIWNNLRTRFKNTYEHVKGVKVHKHCDLISIPNNEQLKEELSYPKRLDRNGRWLIEGKKDMKSRGLNSPNHADALAYCFADVVNSNSNKVVKEFKMTKGSGNFVAIDVDNVGGWQYVVSLHVGETNNIDVLFTRFKAYGGIFQVIHEISSNELDIRRLMQNLELYVDKHSTEMDNVMWVANREIFKGIDKGQAHIVELFRKAGIRLRENFSEDDQLAMVTADRLFQDGKLQISQECKSLAVQISSATVSNKKVDKRYGLVKALMLLLTHLKERHQELVEPEFDRGYGVKKEKKVQDMLQKLMFG